MRMLDCRARYSYQVDLPEYDVALQVHTSSLYSVFYRYLANVSNVAMLLALQACRPRLALLAAL